MPKNETSTKKHLSATVFYLLAGLVMGWPSLVASGYLVPAWKEGVVSSPLSLAALHLMILGSMMTVAFGVLYQIIPIAFRAPPVPRHVLYWHLPIHILSVLLMAAGFLYMDFDVVGFGGTLLLCSTAAYFSLIVRSYLRAQNKTLVHKGLVLPFVGLWLVMLLGIFQAVFPERVTERVVLTHVLLGGFLFWGGLVLVFSYKLVPMFAISHGYKASMPFSATTYFAGVALMLAGTWVPDTAGTVIRIAGGAGLLLGLVRFSWDVIAIVRARKRRRLVMPLYDAFVANLMFVLGIAGIVLDVVFATPNWLDACAYLFGFGGLIGLMLSYMQKILPFLWFEYRFSKRPERKTAPLIDDMVPKRTARVGMAVYLIGVVAGFVGMVPPQLPQWSRILGWGSGAALTVGSLLVFGALRKVLTIGGKRPADDVNTFPRCGGQ